ncbi:MAG: helix-turn-helix domain-containing protein [Desulfomonilaceae bacterium]
MRNHRLTGCLLAVALLLMLIPLYPAECQNYFEYNIQIRSDGSALWTIQQFSSANATVQTWDDFQGRVFDLVDSAQSVTHRGMDVDDSSLQINTTIYAESKITEYSFLWRNFSVSRGSELSFGDVFQVNGFFNQLFGDAALQLTYPSDYAVKSVYPPPYERQDATYTLKWARTQDLGANTSVVLTLQQGGSSGPTPRQYGFLIILVVAAGIAVSVLGFYVVKRRRGNGKTAQETSVPPSALVTEEDKILRLLRTSGGTMRQSEITERTKFSKAKTSQLLTSLEGDGKLARYKKGRDKIVTLNQRVKEE